MSNVSGHSVCPNPVADANGSLLTINQVRNRAQLSRRFIEGQIKSGRLPAVRFSPRAIRVDARDLEAFITGRKTATPKQEGGAA